MREFIAQYPGWARWGVESSRGWFTGFADIAVDWFQSSREVPQLALQMTGSDIIRAGNDPARRSFIDGSAAITRQINFVLYIRQHSGSSGERADTNELLLDFIAWLDLMDFRRHSPVFGDEPQDESTWATGGRFAALWEGETPASVYEVQIHKTYTTNYESED